jgi:(4-(4-[2-(gamma-L-glutamylamino)ethyl]phenoxymethyl)furan-2-yl)methanamine synthase
MRERTVIGWDIGGAHVKAALLRGGAVLDAAQWPCPLWQGLDHLERVLAQAQARWPSLSEHAHAVTMTGEMVDLFAHREDGVQRIAELLDGQLPAPRFFAGDGGWFGAAQAGTQWEQIASANWLATARHAARALPHAEGLLVDIGSTTTDLIAFRRGHVITASRSDAQRLQHGELVYQGVVRTPLCALAQRIDWRGARLNVMNEFFATTADVYRLTGELDAAHDQHPSADNAPKDAAHTRARLARMIGLDERDGSAAQWLAFARAWRAEQLAELRGQVERVVADHDLAGGATVVAAGCGAFLVPELVPDGWRFAAYASEVARLAPDAMAGVGGWVQVGAPAVAVAALYEQEQA